LRWRPRRPTHRPGDPCWWLYGGNNQMVAWAGETFASTYNAERAAQAFKAGARTATHDVYLDAGGDWRWRAIRGANKVASSGESFAGKYEADRAAQNVRDNAGCNRSVTGQSRKAAPGNGAAFLFWNQAASSASNPGMDCQWTLVTARWRTWELPVGGQ
jgi:hypothetical protein